MSLRVQEQYPDVREPGAFGQASEHIRPIACVLAHTPRGTCPIVERLRVSPHASRVLSSRAIAGGELEELLRLFGPLAERQRTDLKRATDIVLVEEGKLIYWPRTGEVFADASYAMARVQATLA